MPLGKSLNTILDDYFGEDQVQTTIDIGSSTKVSEILVNQITISQYQTRTKFDSEKIEKLAQNIKTQGLIQPIVVLRKKITSSPIPEYILLAGERRLRAVKSLGQNTILAVVRDEESLSEQDQAMISAMENLQREDLSPIEMAQTFKMLMLTQHLSEAELAEMLGHSEQYVKNYLRLMNLTKIVQKALLERKIGEGQARYLVNLVEQDQEKILNKIIRENLTVKEVEKLVKSLNNKVQETKPKAKLKVFTHSQATEILPKLEKLTQMFPGAKMQCVGDDRQGKIVISWKEA